MSEKIIPQKANFSSFLMATRPKTLPASVGPICVALALSYSVTGQVDFIILVSALLTFLSLQIAVNLLNDVLDFKKGADTKERLGPQRVTQSGLFTPFQVALFGTLFLALSFITAIPLIAKGGVVIPIICLISAFGTYIYTGGPYPLAYHGLGELFVLLFYGFTAVISLYYIETKSVSFSVFLAALQIGLLVTAILSINNMRDVVEDTKSNKRTLAVRLGEKTFKRFITFLLISPYFFGTLWILLDMPLSFYLPLVLMPFSLSFAKKICRTPPSKAYNKFLAQCALMQLLFGVILSISFNV